MKPFVMPENFEEMMQEMRESIIAEKISAILESAYEYETAHKDAGSNYAHIPSESWTDWDDSNLAEFCRENGIDTRGIEPDILAEIALDNFTMNTAHVYSDTPNGGSRFCLGFYPIHEIETQICFTELSEACGFPVSALDIGAEMQRNFAINLQRDCLLAYQATDSAWIAEIEASKLQEAINDYEL